MSTKITIEVTPTIAEQILTTYLESTHFPEVLFSRLINTYNLRAHDLHAAGKTLDADYLMACVRRMQAFANAERKAAEVYYLGGEVR